MDTESVEMQLAASQMDKNKMIKRAKKMLTRDLQNYLNLSGKHRFDLSSPGLDPTGVSNHGGTNHTEDQFDLGIAAGYCVDAINDTLHDLQPLYFQILLYKYIYETPYHERLTDWQIMNKIGHSGGNYYHILENALFQFASRLKHWAEKDHADLPNTIFYLNDQAT